MRNRPELALHDIPKKANTILQLFLLVILALGGRVVYLAINRHDAAAREAFRGRKRALFETAPRGTIRDCQNVLLATNTTEYEARVLWANIQQITDRKLRKKYVTALSHKIARILKSDPCDIEDTLYSFAALNPHIPYVLQKGLTEQQYYALRGIEHLYPGLEAARTFRRVYPQGKVACHVLGYTAAIQKNEYNNLLHKRHELERALQAHADDMDTGIGYEPFDYAETKRKLDKLNRQAYTLLDRVGKTGIEGSYEEALRGKRGMSRYFANAQGNLIRPLSGKMSLLPGDRIVLSLSSELQEHCEKLLAESDIERRSYFDQEVTSFKPSVMNPFQRGGAIIAIDPKTGEIRALASFPRFDPNDFSPSTTETKQLHQWLVQSSFVEKLWNKTLPYLHETYNKKSDTIENEEIWLSWNRFLNLILPGNSSLHTLLNGNQPVIEFIKTQQALYKLADIFGIAPDELLYYLYQESPAEAMPTPDCIRYKRDLDAYMLKVETHDERMLMIDLMRLIVRLEDLSPQSLDPIKNITVSQFRELVITASQQYQLLKKEAYNSFWKTAFRSWRKENESSFLKQIRQQEKKEKKRAEPYLTLLRREAKRQFQEKWDESWEEWFSRYLSFKEQKIDLNSALIPLLIRSSSIDFQLLGTYTHLPKFDSNQTGLSLLSSINSVLLPSASSFAFQTTSPQGSIFKLAVAYTALLQRDKECKGKFSASDVNFFEIIDRSYKDKSKQYVGLFLDGKPIPQIYKGGRIPKSSHPDFGRLNLSQAIVVSSNPYFSLLASDYIESPAMLEQVAYLFGYGTKTGIDLPAEGKGNFPNDLATNKTGLYTTAIGQHTLLSTPLQTAVMMSALANGGKILVPKVMKRTIAMDVRKEDAALLPKADALRLLDLPPSIFLGTESRVNQIQIETKPEIVQREVIMPHEVQKCLMKSMQGAVQRIVSDTHSRYRQKLHAHPEMERSFNRICQNLIGKTSTAEVNTRFGLEHPKNPFLYNHIWFSGMYYKEDKPFMMQTPDLVVIVYLRYGGYGREALPIATSVISKWLEISKFK